MVRDYTDYFRQLAIRHKDLLHDPTSETGDGPIGSMHFTKTSADEVLVALRTGIGFPCLCLELYDTVIEAESIAAIQEDNTGAFMIVDNPVNKNFSSEQAVFEKTERICREILQQIWQDHYSANAGCETPFDSFDFDKITITPVSRIFSGQSGFRVIFSFKPFNQLSLTDAPPAGTFLPPLI